MKPRPEWSLKINWRESVLLVAVLGLALALRLWRLNAQSFWFDEGWTSWAIQQRWPEMLELLARDNHPPLYFALIKLWSGIWGVGDIALRAFSVLCDLGTVALLYVMGKRLWRAPVGLLAALIAAVSPPLVIYAQEARMYSLVTLLVLAATYQLARALQDTAARGHWAWSYALCMSAALYTHHLAWLAFCAHAPILLFMALTRRDGRPLLAGMLVPLLYLPLLPQTLLQTTVSRGMSWKPVLEVPVVVTDLWLFLNLGSVGGRRALTPATWAALGLTLAGLGLAWRTGLRRWAIVVLSLVVPFLITCALQTQMPFYTDRYLLYLAPGYYLLLALGAWQLGTYVGRRKHWLTALASAILIGLLLLPMARELDRYYVGQGPLKSDFKTVAAHIQEAASPGDALALVQTAPPFLQYYRGDLMWQAFPQVSVDDFCDDEQKIASQLRTIAKPGASIWWVGYDLNVADPQNLVEAQLRDHADYWDEAWWQSSPRQVPVRVAVYRVRDTDFGPLPRMSVAATFADELKLEAYDIQRDSRGNLFVGLWWNTLAQPARNYNVFVHLIDQDGSILSQDDHMPLNVYYPIGLWQPGHTWRDEHKLALPKDVALTDLRLRIGLSWGDQGEHQLPISSGPWQGNTYLIVPAQRTDGLAPSTAAP